VRPSSSMITRLYFEARRTMAGSVPVAVNISHGRIVCIVASHSIVSFLCTLQLSAMRLFLLAHARVPTKY
jgi:hypothetical protein